MQNIIIVNDFLEIGSSKYEGIKKKRCRSCDKRIEEGV